MLSPFHQLIDRLLSPEILAALLLLIVALPLAGALLGYILRRSPDLAAYLGMVTLLASAGLSITLLMSPEISDGDERSSVGATFAAINLPSSNKVHISLQTLMPLSDVPPEYLSGYPAEVSRRIVDAPPVDALPIALNAGRGHLMFTATTALIAYLCLLVGLWERRGDPRRGFFFATLTLFSSAMLLFLCADTLLLIYLAWELMGLCSFLLIGYAGTAKARRSAREAFWTTRATDFGLLLAVIILMGRFGWTTLSSVSPSIYIANFMRDFPTADVGTLVAQSAPWFTAAALLVLLAVIGKAALFPLSFWLPEAMVAPAPVSALLHAATMVAAGPFLLIQLKPLLINSPSALATCAIVAGISLVLTGLMALTARDAKRVLAYSTVSQLSIVVLGVACLSNEAALYHLLAHAWYKAPLFLAVGCLAALATTHRGGNVHVAAHSGDADDRDDHTLLTRMAGSARRYPLVLATLVLGGLALAGVAFTGGFFGKEQIMLALQNRAGQIYQGDLTFGAAYGAATSAWRIGYVLLLISLPLTAAYTARLVGILGWGKAQSDEAAERTPAGTPVSMTPVLVAALFGCIGLAALFPRFREAFTNSDQPWRWAIAPGNLVAMDIVLVLAGGLFAWWFSVARYGKATAVPTGTLTRLTNFFAHGMYLREFWTALAGRGGGIIARLADKSEREVVERVMDRTGHDGRRLARASDWFDRHVVDGLRYWGAEVWWVIRRGHQRLLQTGSIQHYMLVIVISAVLLCFVVLRPLAKAFGEILGRM